jgi:hypothetical protein
VPPWTAGELAAAFRERLPDWTVPSVYSSYRPRRTFVVIILNGYVNKCIEL